MEYKVPQSLRMGDNFDGIQSTTVSRDGWWPQWNIKYHSLLGWVITSMEYKAAQSPGMGDDLNGIQNTTVYRDEW